MLPNLARQVALTLCVPLMILLDRFAWYGSRSVAPQYMESELGFPITEVYNWYGGVTTAMAVVPILGALTAIATGPYVPMVIGTALLFIGHLTLLFCPQDLILVPIGLIVAGAGFFKPTVWAAAANALPNPFTNWRHALFVAIYVAVNLGALLASTGATWVSDAFGPAAALSMFVVPYGLVALLAVGLTAIHFYSLDRPVIPRSIRITAPVAGAGLALVAIPMWGAVELPWNGMWSRFDEAGMSDWFSWSYTINPAVITATGLLVIAFYAGAHLARLWVPTIAIAGFGLALMTGSSLLMMIPFEQLGPEALLIGVFTLMAVAAFGELLAGPLLMSRVVGDTHFRLTTLMMAWWSFCSTLPGTAMYLLPYSDLADTVRTGVGVGFALIGVILGLGLMALGWPLAKMAFEPPPSHSDDHEAAPA